MTLKLKLTSFVLQKHNKEIRSNPLLKQISQKKKKKGSDKKQGNMPF